MNSEYPKPEVEKVKKKLEHRPSRLGCEYAPLIDYGGELHIDGYADGDGVEVWLNTGVADFDGLCIGSGATRAEAIAIAVRLLERAVEVLQGPPPIGALSADAIAHLQRRLKADAVLASIAGALETSTRLGADVDEPEGVRYIQISETLARSWVEQIRGARS